MPEFIIMAVWEIKSESIGYAKNKVGLDQLAFANVLPQSIMCFSIWISWIHFLRKTCEYQVLNSKKWKIFMNLNDPEGEI